MLTLLTLNTANYDDHPGWLDRLGFIANAILKSGANVVCLTEIRYTQDNPFNSYAPTYWANQGVTPPADPASMADQIVALLSAQQPDLWQQFTDVSDQYGPEQWEGLTILTTLSAADHGSFTMAGDGNTRLTQYVTVTTPSGNAVTVYNTHYALTEQSREQDSESIMEAIGNAGSTWFAIAGDFNATPDDPAITALAGAGYADIWAQLEPDAAGYSFAAPNPVKRIDYVWGSPSLAAAAQSIAIIPAFDPVDGQAQGGTVYLSDHLGLVATFDA